MVMEYDITVIRPEMRVEQVMLRGVDATQDERHALRKALRTLHTLEIMATKIYACQITAKPCLLNAALTGAMCNEMTHMQDFQTKLYEHGFKPSKLRFSYWLVGYAFGLGSRLLGTRRILKTGVWVEGKAVRHYAELLAAVKWDADTRAIIEKDQADESGHVARWEKLLLSPASLC
jgi:demethoxyubiquinone hydroxylase (CLK1/Coq7/Cat5 family)